MIKQVVLIAGSMLVVAVAYFLFRGFHKADRDYERLYEKIVSSDKYKAKGQYD